MRLCIIIPSYEYKTQAGVRIRYERIRDHLVDIGIELTIEVVDAIGPDMATNYDVYIYSKCYDARAFIVANLLKVAGKLVGVDLFDDYFSQISDSRLEYLREWVRKMETLVDFTLCSTARMREVAASLMPDHPCHLLNDPVSDFDAAIVGGILEEKLERVRATSTIDVAWFGVGDNPSFPVGLHDLVAMGDCLRQLDTRGLRPRLKILTNKRALTVNQLQMLNRVGVPLSVEEWSEERQRSLLAESFVSFLPVNAQPFSIAKSLNRCVTALASGTQVLSGGYPLYEPFDGLIYRQPSRLVDDILNGRPALSSATVGELSNAFGEWASPVHETHALAKFLFKAFLAQQEKNAGRRQPLQRRIGVMHGSRSSGHCHKLAQQLGYLSIGTPFSAPTLNYDVLFRVAESGDGIEVLVSKRAEAQLGADLRPLLVESTSPTGRQVKAMKLQGAKGVASVAIGYPQAGRSKLHTLARYGDVMRAVQTSVEQIFPGVSSYFSEQDPALASCVPRASGVGSQKEKG